MIEHLRTALAARDATEQRLRQFVADASHELRTPLAAIRAHTEYALRDRADLPAHVTTALNRIETAALRMAALVDDLLLLARLDAGRPLAQDRVDLTRLVLDSVADAHAAAPEHRWLLDLPEEPVEVAGDADRLHQILANLLSNARTHTPTGTTVTTRLRSTPSGVDLEVSDDGPGIPPDLRANLFDRFVRGDAARATGHGSSGLGLAIAYGIATAHAGTLTVTGDDGHTRFRLHLPR